MYDADLQIALEARDRAIAIAKTQSGLARIVGCTPGNIWQLVQKKSPLPPGFVLKAEAATGVSRYRLRPDLYPLPHGETLPVLPSIPSSDKPVASRRKRILHAVAQA